MAFKSSGPVNEHQWTLVTSSRKEVNNIGGLWSGLSEVSDKNCVTDLEPGRELRKGGCHQFTLTKCLLWRTCPPSSCTGGEHLDGIIPLF